MGESKVAESFPSAVAVGSGAADSSAAGADRLLPQDKGEGRR
ncbi:hypothetical protein RISK_001948 [Rhodopirellula islandica]|uniref:Uncharacterized protein n=1 Tax=Rhodopirellula islandica TaxID=595434 RepID=A0A0J1BHU7_RHOIS|nr:hypothetical protein RISK_001948 [Rhodopirellula islandica]